MSYILNTALQRVSEVFNSSFQQAFLPQRAERIQRQEQLLVGNTRHDFSGFPVYISFKNEQYPRVLIAAPTNSGKTTLICNLIYEAFNNGILPFILFDVKNEYLQQIAKSFNYFNSGYLLENAISRFVPEFIRRATNSAFANYTPFQFDLNNLEATDIATILDFNKTEDITVRVGLAHLLASIPREQRNISNVLNIIRNKKVFDELTMHNIATQTHRTIVSRLMMANIYYLLGKKMINMRDYFSAFRIMDFCFQGYDNTDKNYTYAYLAVLDRIKRYIIEHSHLRMLTVIDEAHEILPSESDPACKKEIDLSIRKTRKYNEAIILSTQEISGLDKRIIKNCQEFIISPKTPFSDVKYLLDELNLMEEKRYKLLYEVLPRMKERAARLQFWPWLKISNLGEVQPFFPFVSIK